MLDSVVGHVIQGGGHMTQHGLHVFAAAKLPGKVLVIQHLCRERGCGLMNGIRPDLTNQLCCR